jgi:hypothetical protein
MDATAYLGTGQDVDLSSGQRSCVPRGETIDATYRSAWWRGDGEPRFLLAGHGCGAQIHAVPLADWTECGASESEPQECARLCAQDACPGELDWNTLTACEAEAPCPAAVQNYDCDSTESDLRCVHQALASRTPGRYDIEFAAPNAGSSWALLVSGDGSVQLTSRNWDTNACYSALSGIWQPSQFCELAEAAFFTMCYESQTWCGGDLDRCQSEQLDGWILGCVEAHPACP